MSKQARITIITIAAIATITSIAHAWLGTYLPDAAIEYSAGSFVVGASGGVLHDITGPSKWKDNAVTSFSTIIGYAHSGESGLTLAQADARVSLIQIWGWLDTDGDGAATLNDSRVGSRTTKWVKLSEIVPGSGGGGESYDAIVNSQTPYAYWRLGESSGTTADNDEGTAARDGTYVNTPTLSESGAIGGGNTAVAFVEANSERVDVDGVVSIGGDMATTGFSFACWLKTTAADQSILFAGEDGSNDTFQIRINAGITSGAFIDDEDKIAVRWESDDAASRQTSVTQSDIAALNDGSWHHIAVTYSAAGETWAIYFDGTAQTVITTSEPPASTANWDTAAIAGSSVHGVYLDGTLDEVVVYKKALDATEVQAQYDESTNAHVIGWETSTPGSPSTWGDIIQDAGGGTPIPVAGGESWLLIVRCVNTSGDVNLMDAVSGTEQWENGDTSDGIGSDVPADAYTDADGNTPGTSDGKIDDDDVVWVYINESG